MTDPDMTIDTSAEHLENAYLPMMQEVHTDPDTPCVSQGDLPRALTEASKDKSAAQWAYERVILYIQHFESQLDNDHEVGISLAGSNAGVIRIEGLGYFAPDIITFYGINEEGAKTLLVQHVSQLNVTLIASAKQLDQPEPARIGFQLAAALEREKK